MPTSWTILGVVLALGGVAVAAYLTGHSSGVSAENQRWSLVVAEQRAAAEEELRVKTARVLELEREYSDLAAIAAQKEAENARSLDDAYTAARAAVAHAGGLRDPSAHRGGCGKPSASSSTTGANGSSPGAAAPGVLSEEAEQFLFEFAREADQLNLDFEAVRSDNQRLRAMMLDAAK